MRHDPAIDAGAPRRSPGIAIPIAFVAVLCGCAGPIHVSQEKRAAIDAIAVSETVMVTDKPQFLSGIGSLFAPGTTAEQDKHRQYAAFLRSSGIDVGSIAKSAFEVKLRENPTYDAKVRATASYRFEIEVYYHALVQRTSFTDDYRPTIGLRVKLLGPGGEILGEGRGSSCVFGDCVPYQKLDHIRAKPEILKTQYEAAAKDAIRQVLEVF